MLLFRKLARAEVDPIRQIPQQRQYALTVMQRRAFQISENIPQLRVGINCDKRTAKFDDCLPSGADRYHLSIAAGIRQHSSQICHNATAPSAETLRCRLTLTFSSAGLFAVSVRGNCKLERQLQIIAYFSIA